MTTKRQTKTNTPVTMKKSCTPNIATTGMVSSGEKNCPIKRELVR
jgi:hypothetical protein